jgi:CHAT domain-containing protein
MGGLRSVLAVIVLAGALAAPAHAAEAEPRALLRSAEALQQSGHRNKALELLERARPAAEAGGDRALIAAVHGALGKAYLLAGRRDEARVLLARSLEGARAAGSMAIEAAALNDLGNLAFIDGSLVEAIGSYERSLETARRGGAPLEASRAATNLARARLGRQFPAGALAALDEAERALDVLARPDALATALLPIADLLERVHALTGERPTLVRAFRLYARVFELGMASGNLRAVAYARGGMARAYEADRRYGEALDLTRQALAAAQAGGAEDTMYRWHWQLGRLLAAQASPEEALAAYRRAVASFQAVRADLILELRALNQSYREAVAPLYLEYADLLLRRARQDPAGSGKHLLEARDLVEQFKSVELEDYFQDECIARLQAKQKTIDKVADNTAIIYPIVLADRVEVLLSLPAGMRQVTLPVAADRLTSDLHEFRRLLEKRTTREFLPLAQAVYSWFFAPLEADLAAARVDTVVVVPDGALRSIPFAALHDGKDFLVRRYAFATAPGLSLVEPQPLAGQDRQVLLTGLSESRQQFPPLPYVTDEIAALQKMTGGRTLRDADFQLGNLERELKRVPYSVVHIASHGHFDSDPRKSFLLTYEGRLSMDGLERYMGLTRFRDNPVELLTLSACRTAAGDDRAALGLAGVAVKAGARSAIATLWFINDQASSRLVTDFYGLLGTTGTSKVKALQAAQQRMLADPRYRHPGYWSPFLLIGNWL